MSSRKPLFFPRDGKHRVGACAAFFVERTFSTPTTSEGPDPPPAGKPRAPPPDWFISIPKLFTTPRMTINVRTL
eukprot:11219310-Lingulodinium_polyedra.AAC.1